MAENNSKILVLLNQIAQEQKLQDHAITVEPISSGGANYTSILFLARITSKNKNDLNLFVKVAAMGEKIRGANTLRIYDAEKYIYTELKAVFRRLENKYNLVERDRLGMSEYYGASTVYMEEMVVLENLLTRGFVCHDRMKSVNWKYASSATSEAAKLHALSIAYEHHYPDEYANALKVLNHEWLIENIDSMREFFEGNRQSALNVVRIENRDKLKKFFDDNNLDSFWASYEPERRKVLIHGDYRPSNLMHRERDDGSIEVIPVDYQTIRAGCPIVDLLYFIFTGTDAEFRKNYYEKLVEHYYSELRAAMTRLGLNPDEKYSRNDFEFELEKKLQFGLVVAVFTLPIVTVEAENAPKVNADLELSDFSIQKTGSLYPERLNGVVDDFVRWGVI